MVRCNSLFLLVALLLTSGALGAQAATQTNTVAVPKYTVIPVVLDDTLSSGKNKVGDKFEVHCTGTNCGGFPANTTFVGTVLEAYPKQSKAPGKLKVKFTQAVLPDNTKVSIQAVPSTAEGVKGEGATGKSAKTTRAKRGTAAGALVGGLAGGWGGAAIGAGAGYLAGKATEGKYEDITVPAGTKGYIVLTQPATFKR